MHDFAEVVMGSEFRIVVHSADSSVVRVAARAAFARARDLDARLSDWRSDSELSRLSKIAGVDSCARVSPDLLYVLGRGQEFAIASEGSFDMTIGPMSRLWRWGRRRGQLASQARLRHAREAVGYRKLVVDSARQCVRLTAPEMRLDLGGIAKGYAADEMLRTLKAHGLTMALIDAGGDIVVGDPPPGSHGWLVQVSTVDESGRVVQESLRLTNAAVASSGDAYRYLEIDGIRYSHILDPMTGYGITVRRLVTAVARSAIEADALASAISVMGCDGLRLVEEKSRRAWVIELAGDGRTKLCGTDPGEVSATDQINLLSQTDRK